MLHTFVPTRADLRALIRLAVPFVAVQVGLMLLGTIDTIVVGHYSSRELAAATLGNLYVFGLMMFGMGVLFALDPIVSQAMGARDREGVTLAMQRGLLLATLIGAVLTLLCLPAEAVLRALHEPADVVPIAGAFVRISAPGMIPLLWFVTLRQGLQAMKITVPSMLTILAGNLLNLSLNLVFVFGRFGLPAMGARGSALASTFGRFAMVVLLLSFARPALAPYLSNVRREVFERGPLLRTLRLGLPIGLQMSAEFMMFGVISLMAGWFGNDAISGHQVAINLASLSFMVPAGIGGAAAVLVGHAIGEGDPLHARRIAASALACGMGFMACGAVVFSTIPSVFAHLYSSLPGVVAMASSLIPIAGVFQVFDGAQVVSAGILRGSGDTHAPMWVNLAGYGLVGMPVSLWLGFHEHMGVVGLWWGFVAGLAAVGIVLVLRVRVRLSGDVRRVRIEGPGH